MLNPDKSIPGSLVVRDISASNDNDDDDNDEDDGEEEIDGDKLTQNQVDEYRIILMNKDRQKLSDDMEELLLGDQAGDPFIMLKRFQTHVCQDQGPKKV